MGGETAHPVVGDAGVGVFRDGDGIVEVHRRRRRPECRNRQNGYDGAEFGHLNLLSEVRFRHLDLCVSTSLCGIIYHYSIYT